MTTRFKNNTHRVEFLASLNFVPLLSYTFSYSIPVMLWGTLTYIRIILISLSKLQFVSGSTEKHTDQLLAEGSDISSLLVWEDLLEEIKSLLSTHEDKLCSVPWQMTFLLQICLIVWRANETLYEWALVRCAWLCQGANASGSVSDKAFPPVWVWMLTVDCYT